MNSPLAFAQLANIAPESVGMSSDRLQRVDELAQHYVDEAKYSGIVALIARDGEIVHTSAAGVFGIDNPQPLTLDTLFRIFSMTKPITAVAAMILYEEGKFHIDDPVSKYLPEFASQQLWRDDQLVDPASPMTMRQLFTHSAGLSYGWTEDPVDKLYQQADLFQSEDLGEFMSKLAKLPLRFEPGTRYYYSVAYDVLGAVIERISGQPLDEFFHTRIFKPLKMTDTYFQIPESQKHRLPSDQYWDYEKNAIAIVPPEQRVRYDNVTLFSGGGGLISTIGDYFRFSQMVLNGGSLDGVQILGPKTVEFMRLNHLSPAVRAEGVGEFPETDLFAGQSMGLGYGLVTNPEWMPDISSQGELSWGGLAGTKFWIDPKERLIGIGLVQLYQSPWLLRFDLKSATYPALTELYTE